MQIRVIVRPNTYHDSVSLMAISQRLSEAPGVLSAVVAMGTDMNKELLRNVGLFTEQAAGAGPGDLVIAVGAESAAAADEAMASAVAMLAAGQAVVEAAGAAGPPPRTLAAAVRTVPDARLVLISVPGRFAAREARQALEHGLDVMLFSDSVTLEDEVRLKRLALEKGRLLMGPDCGTAMIDGVGLGFANAVRRGGVGIVAASGTGAQELSCLIDRLGAGVSQLIGTGGRDLSAAVGGLMTLEGLRRLQADPATRVIVLVSKPPAPEAVEPVMTAALAGPKPVVVCFLGGEGAISIDEAAVRAAALARGESQGVVAARLGGTVLPVLAFEDGRRYVRGLFSGGTLCDQALLVLERELGPVTCNVHPVAGRQGGEERSTGHTLLDLGDDRFTAGRPHPMIDPAVRRQRLLQEAADPETAVILLDMVLGHGAHSDPAGAFSGAIREAVGQGAAVVASVTGTEADPQGLGAQEAALRAAGAVVAPTARQAAELVAASLKGRCRA